MGECCRLGLEDFKLSTGAMGSVGELVAPNLLWLVDLAGRQELLRGFHSAVPEGPCTML